jgi:hypothetical protein
VNDEPGVRELISEGKMAESRALLATMTPALTR